MRKLLIIGCLLVAFGAQTVLASNSDLSEAIKLYKAGNYTECYARLSELSKIDSANALIYYYLGMSAAQMGREDEASQNYSKAITLSPKNSTLHRYAKKGQACLDNSDSCNNAMYDSPIDAFIQANSDKSTEQVKSDYERLRIENLMRDINRNRDIEPARFKEYKDFSSMNDGNVPSNDEVVAALRTLKKAGFSNGFQNDISMLYGDKQEDSVLNMMNGASVNPQIMQTLLMNKMSLGF